MKWVICDWANNLKFNGLEFDYYEEAHVFLCEYVVEEDLEEFWVRPYVEYRKTQLA